MKKTVKKVTTAIIATVMCMSATTAAFAASTTDTPVVDENNSNAEFQLFCISLIFKLCADLIDDVLRVLALRKLGQY